MASKEYPTFTQYSTTEIGTNGDWRRLHNEELHSLYRPPNVVRVIKSRRLRWAGHVARIEEGWGVFKIFNSCTYRKETFREV